MITAIRLRHVTSTLLFMGPPRDGSGFCVCTYRWFRVGRSTYLQGDTPIVFVVVFVVEKGHMADPKLLQKVTLATAAFSIIFAVVSTALPNWHAALGESIGLWQLCTSNCVSYACPAGSCHAARAFAILSVLMSVAAATTMALKFFKYHDMGLLLKLTSGLAGGAAFMVLLTVICFVVFLVNLGGFNSSIGFSLACVAMGIDVSTASLAISLYKKENAAQPSA
ncbi:uncharacterized protein LOC144722689 isoform X1 [Lampetra planeri]